MPVDKSGQRVREMFGAIAGRYDLLNHVLSLNIDKAWRAKTIRAVPPAGDAPILDVCTGTGDLALAYYKATGGRTPIVGVDFCLPMLERAAAKAQAAGANGQLTFLEADAQALPFPDDRFQIVCVAFGLRNVSDTDRGLQEMVRVCRPGGTVAVLEFSQPRLAPLRGLYGWYFRHVLPKIGQWVSRSGSGAYHYLPQSVGEFPSYDALLERMRSAGLEACRYTPLTFGVATLYEGRKPGLPCAADPAAETQTPAPQSAAGDAR